MWKHCWRLFQETRWRLFRGSNESPGNNKQNLHRFRRSLIILGRRHKFQESINDAAGPPWLFWSSAACLCSSGAPGLSHLLWCVFDLNGRQPESAGRWKQLSPWRNVKHRQVCWQWLLADSPLRVTPRHTSPPCLYIHTRVRTLQLIPRFYRDRDVRPRPHTRDLLSSRASDPCWTNVVRHLTSGLLHL